jgi:RimJ/RimL family protein N-acetyltransferase
MGRNGFEGTEVRLRAVEPGEAEAWFASGLDTDLDRLADQTHLPYAHVVCRQRAEDVSKRPEDDSVVLVIETLDGEVVGGMSVQTPNRRARVFSFGGGIAWEHWRKGYATEALVLLFRLYFTELGYQKVESGVYAFNEPSLRFQDAFRFVVEGRRRRSVFTSGEYHDVVLIGMTAEEFAERHPSCSPPG